MAFVSRHYFINQKQGWLDQKQCSCLEYSFRWYREFSTMDFSARIFRPLAENAPGGRAR